MFVEEVWCWIVAFFRFFFVVLLNLSFDLFFNLIGSSSARFVKKITQKDLHEM